MSHTYLRIFHRRSGSAGVFYHVLGCRSAPLLLYIFLGTFLCTAPEPALAQTIQLICFSDSTLYITSNMSKTVAPVCDNDVHIENTVSCLYIYIPCSLPKANHVFPLLNAHCGVQMYRSRPRVSGRVRTTLTTIILVTQTVVASGVLKRRVGKGQLSFI